MKNTQILPEMFEKHKSNQSLYDERGKHIRWTVRWKFPLAAAQYLEHKYEELEPVDRCILRFVVLFCCLQLSILQMLNSPLIKISVTNSMLGLLIQSQSKSCSQYLWGNRQRTSYDANGTFISTTKFFVLFF